MNYYLVKLLVGGYGAYGHTVDCYDYAKSSKDAVQKALSPYKCRLECIKPIVLGVYIRENGVNIEIEYNKEV